MKIILGLDPGANSIGTAVLAGMENPNGELIPTGIRHLGSRHIPMDAKMLSDFRSGAATSSTNERTQKRIARHMAERRILRRERLLRVLNIMGFLPEHFANSIDRYGKFEEGTEPKIAWKINNEGKSEFIFMQAFEEMVSQFKQNRPDIKSIPYDWTIYYLRTKALSHPVTKEELAWILLNFNQKRGCNLERGEQEETDRKKEEYMCLTVVSVEKIEEKGGKASKYKVLFENGMEYERTAKIKPDWEGKKIELIVTTTLNADGTVQTDKDGKAKVKYRVPKPDDWKLKKVKQDADVKTSGKHVGEYIYDALLHNTSQKIKGALVQAIDRSFYEKELEAILTTQEQFHPELKDASLYAACIEDLYQSNLAYRNSIANKGFIYLLKDDILFYQRPLKKQIVGNCPYEEIHKVNKKTGEVGTFGVKCIAKSNPIFQEFRLWKFINNLHLYRKDDGNDVTKMFLPSTDAYAALFQYLNDKKNIEQTALLNCPHFGLKKKDTKNYRWNYVEDKTYPCNETRALILDRFKKAGLSEDILSDDILERIWHILYSVNKPKELKTALTHFSERYNLGSSFVEAFVTTPPFEKSYGAYSAKAIKKLLPLMRCGSYWKEEDIDNATRERIQNLIDGESNDDISDRVREKTVELTSIEMYQGLPDWLACYVVYNRHSEAKSLEKWTSPDDIDRYLKTFKQHSLNNPVVEQVLLEMLRVVRDIWREEGHIDEIHIELGRDLKSTAEERKNNSRQQQENEERNLRIEALLMEFMNPEYKIDNVKSYSPRHQAKLRLYEEGVYSNTEEIPEDILKIRGKFKKTKENERPTRSDIMRYKLWMDQKYCSPYTGKPISLSRLFTSDYEIDHVIAQARYNDDSMSNKVICESAVNKRKGEMLGHEFIDEHGGERISLGGNRFVDILKTQEYEALINRQFSTNKGKLKKLMLDDIPDDFSQRQLNDTRYIGKLALQLLSNIVREDNEEEAVSKHVISCNGHITDRLKKDWGLNDVWNEIILPRFIRMNRVNSTDQYTTTTENGHTIPAVPFAEKKGFNKKRIDHRHHAMDALVIACASRKIVAFLNNEHASEGKGDIHRRMKHELCSKHKTDNNGNAVWLINKPWPNFTADTSAALKKVVVSIKQNLRVLTKNSNWFTKIDDGQKVRVKQGKGENWGIRKSLHKDSAFGLVCLPHVSLKKDEQCYAIRRELDKSFTIERIKKITDTGIQKFLLKHLEQNNNDAEAAFSPEGIEYLNAHIKELNGGVPHKPICKVRVYEKSTAKFSVGQKGNKSKKFVEADDGTNLYFAIYESEEIDLATGMKKREYYKVPLREAISKLKEGLSPAPQYKNGKNLSFVLSPNDLVYAPTICERESGIDISAIDYNRIYKMVSCDDGICYFIPANVAKVITDAKEYESHNKTQKNDDGEMIKAICLPITINRLGGITNIGT